MKNNLEKAKEIIHNGGILLYPSDTLWAIGCDATNPVAVEKILKLKNSNTSKSLIVLLDNDVKLNRFVKQIPEITWDIVELADKPTTIIYPEGYNLAQNVMAKNKSVAIRIVKDGFCNQILRAIGKPLVSTSANISSKPPALSFSNIDKRILDGVDYIVNLPSDVKLKSKASTIIKIDLDATFTLIRK
jgi:L-threonylcarbamoyladenylate synthase